MTIDVSGQLGILNAEDPRSKVDGLQSGSLPSSEVKDESMVQLNHESLVRREIPLSGDAGRFFRNVSSIWTSAQRPAALAASRRVGVWFCGVTKRGNVS